jgi:outer membrane protein OmpA-like peptidoglycan-associated protein
MPNNAFEELKTRLLNIRGLAILALAAFLMWTAVKFTSDILALIHLVNTSDEIDEMSKNISKENVNRKYKKANDEFRPLYFEFNSDQLDQESSGRLETYAKKIIAVKADQIVIDGHASENSPGYNINLSERRAQNVKKFLVSLGVAAGKIQTNSYGAERPLEGKTATSRYNDRVEIAILD